MRGLRLLLHRIRLNEVSVERNDPVVAPEVLTENRRSTALARFGPPPKSRRTHSDDALFDSLLVPGRPEYGTSRHGLSHRRVRMAVPRRLDGPRTRPRRESASPGTSSLQGGTGAGGRPRSGATWRQVFLPSTRQPLTARTGQTIGHRSPRLRRSRLGSGCARPAGRPARRPSGPRRLSLLRRHRRRRANAWPSRPH